MKTKQTLAVLSVAALTLAGSGFTASGQEDDKWQFGVTLPLWAPSIDGNVTVGGMKQDVSVSFDKLKDHLDAAFSLGLDAHKGRFGLFASGGYMKFSGDYSGPGSGDASSTLKFVSRVPSPASLSIRGVGAPRVIPPP